MKKKWDKKEILLLKEYYSKLNNVDLIKLFPERSYNSVIVKAKKLKLIKNKEVTYNLKSENMLGSNNPMYNRVSSKKNKSYEELYGIEKSNNIKNKLSIIKQGSKGLSGEKNGMYGKTAWNKNRKCSVEEKKKISDAQLKYWNSLTEEESKLRKDKLRREWIIKRNNYKEIDTIPEKFVERILIEERIDYIKKKNIGYYNCDFVIENLVIEVQGDYWHGNPKIYKLDEYDKIQIKNYNRDIRKKTYLTNKGYVLLYLWEFDIKNNIENIKKIIKNEIAGFKK